MKTTYKKFIVPIYDVPVLLIYTDNMINGVKKFESIAKMKLEERSFQGLCGTYDTKFNSVFYVVVVKCKKKEETLGVLVHELFHLTQNILERVGIDFVKEGANESFTYLQEFLFKESTKLIK